MVDTAMDTSEDVQNVAELPEARSNSSQTDSNSDSELAAKDGQTTPITENSDIARNDLEHMFDNDGEDEFSSSASAPPFTLYTVQTSRYTDPEVMRAYYQRLLPFRYLFQWLNHAAAPCHDFQHREFAFTLPNDAYLRYQSFPSHDLFRKQCVELVPSRFEIGPVYSTNPRERKTLRRAAAFKPVSKELVFDIDMTDYDSLRTCCKEGKVCDRCWAFITMAIKVMDVALRDDFGFKHILWVFSGRRGVHAWVCDKRARELDDNKRKAIAGYFELLKGGDSSGKRVNLRRPLHPHIERSLRILRDHFQADVLSSQDPWQNSEKATELLSLIPDPDLRAALSKKWDASPSRSSVNKWGDIDALAEAGDVSDSFDPKKLKEAKQDIVLECTYPRLDAAVSKHLNHLLKSPFCIHPKTGKVCVPIQVSNAESFDPDEVPTVTQLLSEVDAWQGGEDVKIQDWEKTSLKPYVEHFRNFVNDLLREELGGKVKRENDGDAMEF